MRLPLLSCERAVIVFVIDAPLSNTKMSELFMFKLLNIQTVFSEYHLTAIQVTFGILRFILVPNAVCYVSQEAAVSGPNSP